MSDLQNNAQIYKLDKDYRLVTLKGKKCSAFLKNKNNQLIASLEGCQNDFATLTINTDTQELSNMEKRYLLSFIRAKKASITPDIAAELDVSIIKYQDGREEYLSEAQLKKRISKGIDFAKISIGKIASYQLDIPADTKECVYQFNHAEISKITVGENSQITLDLRDNEFIETIDIADNFSGTLNLARSTIESLFIGNNCTVNFNINDTKKCFNLQIGELFNGNVNISNNCLYAVKIGYYSYAEFLLSDNVIKTNISIGNSFRGNFYGLNQTVELIKIGNDCKGKIKISSKNKEVSKLEIGDDFNGILDLDNDDSIEKISFGRKSRGQLQAQNTDKLKQINIGKFYNGKIDLTGSAIENINMAYGAKGRVNLKNCKDFKSLQATMDNKLFLDGNLLLNNVHRREDAIFYNFKNRAQPSAEMPFFKRIYQNIYNRFTS